MINPHMAAAWRRMMHKRNCPPLQVLRKGGELVKKHLSGCSHCRDLLDRYEHLSHAASVISTHADTEIQPTPVRKGDVRFIRPNDSPENFFAANELYYMPPLVLVLDEPDEDGFVKVAQVFDEEDLCDQGDVFIGNNLYAEGWNTYGMHISGLAPQPFLKAGKRRVREVLEMEHLNYGNLDQSSPLFHFRMSEYDTGAFFSLGVNLAAIHEAEESESWNVAEDLFRLAIEKWDDFCQELPLAAASGEPEEEGQRRRVKCLVLDRERRTTETLAADAYVYPLEEGVICSIRLDLPQKPQNFRLLMGGVEGRNESVIQEAGKTVIRAEFPPDAALEDIRVIIIAGRA